MIKRRAVENATSGSAKYYTEAEGVYYVVFDNTDYGEAAPVGNVTIHLEVTVDEDPPGWNTYLICGTLVAGAIIVVFIKVKRKKKRQAKEASADPPMKADPDFAIGAASQEADTPEEEEDNEEMEDDEDDFEWD